MAVPVFPQTVIAVIWDFDKTLLPGYMQKPLFDRFGVDEREFWDEVQALPSFYRERGYPLVSPDTVYLSHILTYVRRGIFDGLSNEVLRQLGTELEFYPGLPEFLPTVKASVETNPRFQKHGIAVEHYIVSTGLRQTILGSSIAPHVEGVWACEFLEMTAPPGFLQREPKRDSEKAPVLEDVGYAIDNTTKTRAIFEINKGVNKHPDEMSVNDTIAPEDRRVPFENMIYVADGPSDIPVFSILNQYGGKTCAVYNPVSEKEFRQVLALHSQGRVQGLGPADYTPETHTALWLTTWVEQVAESIQERRERALRDRLGKPPTHIIEEPVSVEAPQDLVARNAPRASPEPDHPDQPQPDTTGVAEEANTPDPPT
jgi:hypothetical protein